MILGFHFSCLRAQVARDQLKPPTILEAQSADKHLWSVVSDSAQEKSWSLDEALHELTYVRSDMSTWLQARPRLPKPNPLIERR